MMMSEVDPGGALRGWRTTASGLAASGAALRVGAASLYAGETKKRLSTVAGLLARVDSRSNSNYGAQGKSPGTP